MRDINALKRSRTFINEYCDNAVIVDIDKLPYYCYVDIFKEYIPHIPYYFGNCDIFINDDEFQKIKTHFIAKSIQKYSFLKKYCEVKTYNESCITNYFKKLLGENYVY
jgi:hypothetical protein